MKRLIIIVLLMSTANICRADYELRLNDGVTLTWREYTLEGSQYCTQKEIGKFCISKSDVVSLKEITDSSDNAPQVNRVNPSAPEKPTTLKTVEKLPVTGNNALERGRIDKKKGVIENPLSPTGAPWRRIEVLPVFFVPSDERPPTKQQVALLRKHLELAKERYRTMLKNRDTFALSPSCAIYRSQNPLDFFRSKNERLGDFLLAEVLDYFHVDRHTCPYVFVILLMNPHDNIPAGGGIPINAGYNTGGGVLEMSSHRLDTGDGFQSTLEHELGHTFGLPHVDEAYGHDTLTSLSIMSYNPRHKWMGLTPPAEPATLMPEDLNSLVLNKRVFPNFTFDPKTDIPAGYPFVNSIISLYPPVDIPGHPKYRVNVSSDVRTEEGSLANIIPKFIESPDTKKKENIWISGDVPEHEWITLLVECPQVERLTAIALHSQHGGSLNRVESIRIEYAVGNSFTKVVEQEIGSPDVLIRFAEAAAKQWRLSIKPGASRRVTIRGMEFFNGDIQLYPPLYPYKLWLSRSGKAT